MFTSPAVFDDTFSFKLSGTLGFVGLGGLYTHIFWILAIGSVTHIPLFDLPVQFMLCLTMKVGDGFLLLDAASWATPSLSAHKTKKGDLLVSWHAQ